jgi:hypothetical protein
MSSWSRRLRLLKAKLRNHKQKTIKRRLHLEALEDRCVPATFTVTNLVDAAVANPGDAPGTLRQAVFDANNTPGADVIDFQAGLTGTIPLTQGELTVTDAVDVQGPGAAVIAVSGNNSSRIFVLAAATTISGLTLTGGITPNSGGAIMAAADLTLADSVVTGNTAAEGGGGIAADGYYMTLRISNSTISSNVSGSFGGGIQFNGYLSNLDILQNTTITGNTAGDSGGGVAAAGYVNNVQLIDSTISGNTTACTGGGVYLYDVRGSVTVRNSTLDQNTATCDGGGLAVAPSDAQLTIEASTITGNIAVNGNAGGLYLTSTSGAVTIRTSTISGNSGGFGGGLLVAGASAPVVVEDSTISGNTAAIFGGGILAGYLLAPLTIERSTISGNTAGITGGGVHLTGSYSPMLIQNSTISGNTAPTAGGLYANDYASYATLTVRNSTIAGNTATSGPGGGIVAASVIVLESTLVGDNVSPADPDVSGTVLATFSLIEDPSGTTLDPGSANNITLVDPLLGPLQNNGGLTETHALLPGSPALDAGANPAGLLTDQRGLGFPRQSGSDVDIGAFEVQPTGPIDVTDQVSIALGGFRRNRGNGRWYQTVTITNISGAMIAGPVSLVVFNLSANAALFNSSGLVTNFPAYNGWSFLTLTPNDFGPGASIPITLEFTNPSNGPITYTPKVLAGAPAGKGR